MSSQAVLNLTPFQSVLAVSPDDSQMGADEAPVYFSDLNLDQVVDAITADWKEYNLKPFYHAVLKDLGEITYRQEIFLDLEDKALLQGIRSFSERMRTMRSRLKEADEAKRLAYKYAMERLFLGAAELYCEAIQNLRQDLCTAELRSRGLRALRDYLAAYCADTSYVRLEKGARKVKADLSAIRYCLLLKDGSVTVRRCEEETDYSSAVEQIFQKFRHDTPKQYRLEVRNWARINHIEAQIQDRVALLYPDAYLALDNFCTAHAVHLDERIVRFDREIQFYVAYVAYAEKFRCAGLSLCQPELLQGSKQIRAQDAFDMALAGKLIDEKGAVVPNGFFLNNPERILVVSGPNQGGKTTFARMIGQLHHVACLGCPVPGREARLFLFDRLSTHFERQENVANLRGKLHDDLVRIHEILSTATPNSLIIMNEMFSSTTLKDAIYLSARVMERIFELDLLGVWVTFLDELSSLNQKTVSMVSTVDPTNPAIRTYKLERRPADGLAYALAIAQKYKVTYDRLKERIKE